jgi:hypothetical protein
VVCACHSKLCGRLKSGGVPRKRTERPSQRKKACPGMHAYACQPSYSRRPEQKAKNQFSEKTLKDITFENSLKNKEKVVCHKNSATYNPENIILF